MISTQQMLTTVAAYHGTEATASSANGQLPLRAWVCYRAGGACHIQIATEEQQGDTTVFRALTSIPMRDDWEMVNL